MNVFRRWGIALVSALMGVAAADPAAPRIARGVAVSLHVGPHRTPQDD
jgi:hypothetical protein